MTSHCPPWRTCPSLAQPGSQSRVTKYTTAPAPAPSSKTRRPRLTRTLRSHPSPRSRALPRSPLQRRMQQFFRRHLSWPMPQPKLVRQLLRLPLPLRQNHSPTQRPMQARRRAATKTLHRPPSLPRSQRMLLMRTWRRSMHRCHRRLCPISVRFLLLTHRLPHPPLLRRPSPPQAPIPASHHRRCQVRSLHLRHRLPRQ